MSPSMESELLLDNCNAIQRTTAKDSLFSTREDVIGLKPAVKALIVGLSVTVLAVIITVRRIRAPSKSEHKNQVSTIVK
jgi:hypothetical protein